MLSLSSLTRVFSKGQFENFSKDIPDKHLLVHNNCKGLAQVTAASNFQLRAHLS